MLKVILALLTTTETATAILTGAQRLAVLLEEARIEVMFIRTLPISTIMVTEEVLSKAQEKKIRQNEAEKASALKSIFESWATDHSELNTPRWIDQEGITKEIVNALGKRIDYIVVGQPDVHANRAEHAALHAALFASGTLVLMMPRQAKAEFGKIIAIAWRNDKLTLNALLAALQLVPIPKQLHILMRHHNGNSPPKTPDVFNGHNFPVTTQELSISKKAFGAQLLATAHEVKADILIMSAYTHNTWNNLLFGSVTKYILAYTDIPILMRHS